MDIMTDVRKNGFHEVRTCGCCNAPIGYVPHPTLAILMFDSSCDCGGSSEPQPITWETYDKLKETQND